MSAIVRGGLYLCSLGVVEAAAICGIALALHWGQP